MEDREELAGPEQAAGIGIGKRSQKDGVDDAEDQRIGADAEGQC